MAVSTTTRLGLTTWGSGSDQFTRVQMNTSHEQLELLAAGYIQETSLPAAADYKGFFNYSSSGGSAGVLSYSNGDSWFTIGEAAGSVTSVASAPVVGSALAYARADHVHDLTNGVVDADALAIDAVTTDKIVDLNVTTAKIANNNVINSKLAQADATSVIGNATASAATPSYIAAGADGLVLRRASGTLGFGQIIEGSIGPGAVTNTKIGSLAVDDSKISDVAASKLTGTIDTARISGSYTGITGTGVLAAGSISNTFGNINIGTSTFTGNGSGLTTLNASNLSSGAVPNARISGSYTNFTSITVTGTVKAGSSRTLTAIVPCTPTRIQGDRSFAANGSINNFSDSGTLQTSTWLTLTIPSSVGGVTVDDGCIGVILAMSVGSEADKGGFVSIRKHSLGTGTPTTSNLNFNNGIAAGATTFVAIDGSDRLARVWINYTSSTAGRMNIDVLGFVFTS